MTEFAMKVMLAASAIPTDAEIEQHLPLLVSYKMDGVRCAIVGGKAMSRKALPFENLVVQRWAADNAAALMGLDGELVVGEPRSMFEGDDVFNRSSGPIGKVLGAPEFTFWVFEVHDAGGLNAQHRYEFLKNGIVGQGIAPRTRLVEQWLVQSIAEVRAKMAEAVALGYEGLMFKHPKKGYKNGRSTLNEGILMKYKEWIDSEAVVLSVNQGKTNTNEKKRDELGHAKRSSAKAGKVLKETIGSWTVKDLYTGVVFNCPPGKQTEEELKALWEQHEGGVDSHEGKVLTYKSQKVGALYKPRFPGMVRFRPLFDLDMTNVLPEIASIIKD